MKENRKTKSISYELIFGIIIIVKEEEGDDDGVNYMNEVNFHFKIQLVKF